MVRCIRNEEIETLGEALVKSFTEKMEYKPMYCLDIDGFITDYLKADLIYESIAEPDKRKLGFLSDGVSSLKVVKSGKVMDVVYPKNTIVIEKYLLHPCESGRRRFTAAHEAGHIVLQRHCSLETQASFFRLYEGSTGLDRKKKDELYDINEQYANRMAACLLMPRNLMARLLKEYNDGGAVKIYQGVLAAREKLLIQKLADLVGASFTSFLNRLRELKLMETCTIEEYMKERVLKEVTDEQELPFL